MNIYYIIAQIDYSALISQTHHDSFMILATRIFQGSGVKAFDTKSHWYLLLKNFKFYLQLIFLQAHR
jgi:hypothetical protein